MENGSRESSLGYSPLPTKRTDVQRNSSYKNMSAEIEQVVTRLLRTTKSLLEALNLWSQLRMAASDIFDLHRTLESQFYLVSQSFESAHVNTSDLTWIPHQLRQSVMECMEQEPSTVALDRYLPRIRDAIVHLLHGLKGKQQELRDIDMQMPQMSSSPPQPQPGIPLSQRDSYRSQDYRTRSNENYAHNSTNTTTTTNLNYSDSTGSARSTRSYYSQQNHTPPTTISSVGSDRLTRSEYDPYTGGMPQPTTSSDSRHAYGQVSSPSTPNQPSYRKLSHVLSSSSSSSPTQQQPIPSRSASQTLSTQQDKRTTAALPTPPVSAPVSSSSRYLQPTKNDNNKFDESDQHTANALAALKRQENLARRSSVRRASMYRGNNSNNNNNNNSNADYASKRYFADAPPVPSLDRVDENKTSLGTNLGGGPITASPSSSERTDNNNHNNNNTEPNAPPPSSSPAAPANYQSSSSSVTLYLQMDQQMKKVSYSGEITLPALSMLFIERFGYNAGQQDFPSIYIRDPALPNVSYELQDLAEVTDKSILSLTLHDRKEEKSMDWVNSMVKEWNESQRTMLEQMERLEQKVGQRDVDTEALVQQVVRQTLAIAPPQPPTTQQQQDIEAKSTDDTSEPTTTPADDTTIAPTTTTTNSDDNIPATTTTTTTTEAIQIHEDTKAQQQQQQDEIDKLQRQVMILRQAQTEQQEEHAKTVADLEEQNLKLKKAMDDSSKETSGDAQPSTATKSTLSQSRLYIEQGKEELLTSSDKITTRLEDLQDDIDHLKLDVTQRKCRPSETQMDHCREERKALADDIDAFGTYISKVKPIWKKTWEQELQTIVKEQQTLKEQEGLLLDMNDDLAALQEVFENLEKICKFQEKSSSAAGGARHHPPREFHVAPPEDGFEGMTSVFKQVATIDVDHDRRLKALEMADRMRQRELANRTDEFEQELSTFVGSKKLKKTGGAMEIDRLRQEKDKDMLQRLYKEKQQQQRQLAGGASAAVDDGDAGAGGDNSHPRDISGSNDKDDAEQVAETKSNADGASEPENDGAGQDSPS